MPHVLSKWHLLFKGKDVKFHSWIHVWQIIMKYALQVNPAVQTAVSSLNSILS